MMSVLQDSALARYWRSLAARDQRSLIVLGIFVLMLALYVGVWLPVQAQAQAAREWFHQQRDLHRYVLTHAQQAKSIAVPNAAQVHADSLHGAVTQSAQAQGLNIERLEVEVGQLQISLTPVAYARLVPWLQGLQAQGVSVDEMNLERVDTGHVLARLRLSAQP